jgi:hypothetical protein
MSRKNSTAVGIGAAISGAAVAAFIGMGTAHADVAPPGDQGFSILFGGDGTDPGVTAGQASANEAADLSLYQQNPADAAAFNTDVTQFEIGNDHPLEDLIQAIDPSAYSTQVTDGITGTFTESGGYLVPENFLGYVGTSLDYFTLNPTGLDYLLAPVIELLVGSPAF